MPLSLLFSAETSWIVPIYGVIGSILALPWAVGLIRRTGPRPAAYINIFMTVLAFVHSCIVLQQVWGTEPQIQTFEWFTALDLHLDLVLEVSSTSVGASVLVAGMSLLAQVFALGYMEKDWSLARFYALMGFFEGAMSGIALSDSLVLSYGLLEMLTLSTYLLVGFWYAQPLVITAARDAFVTKRVGDLALLMSVVAVVTLTGESRFSELTTWAQTVELPGWVATLIGLGLIAGPVGKCAQFPLHLWLDEAMEGPSPASILRNSVVVAAGAFVLIKVQPILALSPVVDSVLIAIGSITAVGGVLVALAQIDLKRTLSYTTSSALGIVFIAVGLQQTEAALAFLLTHALAKALLFMGVGAVINTTTSQNLQELGGLWSRMPATTIAMATGSAGLVGLLPLGGFWSQIELMDSFAPLQPWLVGLVAVVNGLTTLVLVRAFCLVFLGPTQIKTRRAPEVFWPMAVPMVMLAVLVLMSPWLLTQWDIVAEWTPAARQMAVILMGSSLGGLFVGWFYYLRPGSLRPIQKAWPFTQVPGVDTVRDLFAQDFYTGQIYEKVVVAPVAWLARLSESTDRQVVDGVVNGVSLGTLLGSESLKYTLTGRSQLYVLTILAAVVAVVVMMRTSLI